MSLRLGPGARGDFILTKFGLFRLRRNVGSLKSRRRNSQATHTVSGPPVRRGFRRPAPLTRPHLKISVRCSNGLLVCGSSRGPSWCCRVQSFTLKDFRTHRMAEKAPRDKARRQHKRGKRAVRRVWCFSNRLICRSN